MLIVVRDTAQTTAFADAAAAKLGGAVVAIVKGQPPDLRETLEKLRRAQVRIDAIAATQSTAAWTLVQKLGEEFPKLAGVAIVTPHPYRWPNFLTSDNLINIANRIAVIAIVAIGMTMVIITGGIDLSVGSLIALSAVCATLLIEISAGAENAQPPAWRRVVFAGRDCRLWPGGTHLGHDGHRLRHSPVHRHAGDDADRLGRAYELTGGESVDQLPDSFMWLGRGTNLGVPNAVILMVALYMVAHVIMSRTILGRISMPSAGMPRRPVCRASRCGGYCSWSTRSAAPWPGWAESSWLRIFKSGDPKYGPMAELYVIAAVVVGGTSLSGGEGKVLGTLIGALIIGVIENGMNLTNVESYTQKIVLGAVILGAVLLDTLKRKSWWRRS